MAHAANPLAAYLPAPKPVVTVITPAYNVALYITEAIKSVAAQTERHFEYLIVDDASTDGTDKIVEQLIAGDDRMRLIRTSHGGGAVARNIGLDHAQGQYVSFLDGDDRWHPTKLQGQLEELQRLSSDYGAVFSRSRLISEDGLIVGAQRPTRGTYDLDRILVDNCPMGNGSALLIHRSCFEEVGGFDQQAGVATDWDLWLRIARDSSRPLFWCDGVYRLDYRLRSGQETKSLDRLMASVDVVLNRYSSAMLRLPKAQTFVYHAVTAYRANDTERIARWGTQAWSNGAAHLLRRGDGRRLMGWWILGPAAPVYRIAKEYGLSLARSTAQLIAHKAPRLSRNKTR